MFVRDFLLIELRRHILRRLQRLLHFLREFIDSHIVLSLPDKTHLPLIQVASSEHGRPGSAADGRLACRF
jgi:hypothetical protein